MNDVPVVIVGGGLAGISVAYALSKQGIESLVIEAGKIGEGSDEFLSGTGSPLKPSHTKMVSTAFETDCQTYRNEHGVREAKLLLSILYDGLKRMEENIPNSGVKRKLGAIALGEYPSWAEKELESYRELGFDNGLELWPAKKIKDIFGIETQYDGLYNPHEFTMDTKTYLRLISDNQKIIIAERKKMYKIEEKENCIVVKINGEEITADNAVVATNIFVDNPEIQRLIQPWFSFIQCYEDSGENTPQAWTNNNDYVYFIRSDNILAIGGADLLANRKNGKFVIDDSKAFKILQATTYSMFPRLEGRQPIATHYGLCALTRDGLPLVGKLDEKSRIAYIIGCNGYAHSIYPAAAELMPGILGYKELDEQQKEFADFLSPKRKTLSLK